MTKYVVSIFNMQDSSLLGSKYFPRFATIPCYVIKDLTEKTLNKLKKELRQAYDLEIKEFDKFNTCLRANTSKDNIYIYIDTVDEL